MNDTLFFIKKKTQTEETDGTSNFSLITQNFALVKSWRTGGRLGTFFKFEYITVIF